MRAFSLPGALLNGAHKKIASDYEQHWRWIMQYVPGLIAWMMGIPLVVIVLAYLLF